jgi:uncharacterized protein
MILVDANLLLYAYDAASPNHQAARQWWEDRLSEDRPVRLAWTTLLAFLRISTHPRLLQAPFSLPEATGHVAAWLCRPMVDVLHPTARHWEILRGLVERGQAGGNLVPDAHLAALAVEHGATLCTTDRDFARFDGLALVNPLAAARS